MPCHRLDAGTVLLLLAAGCTGLPRTEEPPAGQQAGARTARPAAVNLSGFSPAFRQGYAAGCDSANAGVAPRDDARLQGDADYRHAL